VGEEDTIVERGKIDFEDDVMDKPPPSPHRTIHNPHAGNNKEWKNRYIDILFIFYYFVHKN